MPKRNVDINVSVTFRHTNSTPALKTYATEKLSHMLQKYVTDATDVQVVLLVEKRDHIAEVNVHSKGYEVSGKGVTEDLYSAIDKVVDNIDRQCRKQKDRVTDHHRHQNATTY